MVIHLDLQNIVLFVSQAYSLRLDLELVPLEVASICDRTGRTGYFESRAFDFSKVEEDERLIHSVEAGLRTDGREYVFGGRVISNPVFSDRLIQRHSMKIAGIFTEGDRQHSNIETLVVGANPKELRAVGIDKDLAQAITEKDKFVMITNINYDIKGVQTQVELNPTPAGIVELYHQVKQIGIIPALISRKKSEYKLLTRERPDHTDTFCEQMAYSASLLQKAMNSVFALYGYEPNQVEGPLVLRVQGDSLTEEKGCPVVALKYPTYRSFTAIPTPHSNYLLSFSDGDGFTGDPDPNNNVYTRIGQFTHNRPNGDATKSADTASVIQLFPCGGPENSHGRHEKKK